MIRRFLKERFLASSYYMGFFFILTRLKRNCVRVLTLHDTPEQYSDQFRRYLEWSCKHFDVLSPENFKQFLIGKYKIKRAGLLFTFDDGYSSHFHVAATLLEEFNLRGLFFLVPGLMEVIPSYHGQDYQYDQGIRISGRQGDKHSKTKHLTDAQIASLHQRGHEIGYHTYSHKLMEEIPDEKLMYELYEGRRVLENLIHTEVESFAWTHSYSNVHVKAYGVIRKYYRYCYTPIPGINSAAQDPHFILRTNVEITYSLPVFRALALGAGDPFWHYKRALVQKKLHVIE